MNNLRKFGKLSEVMHLNSEVSSNEQDAVYKFALLISSTYCKIMFEYDKIEMAHINELSVILSGIFSELSSLRPSLSLVQMEYPLIY